jgi:hypothetical protein
LKYPKWVCSPRIARVMGISTRSDDTCSRNQLVIDAYVGISWEYTPIDFPKQKGLDKPRIGR